MNRKKQVRKAFRQAVMHRDAYRCRCCGVAGKDRNESAEDEGTKFHWAAHHPNLDDSTLVELDAHHISDRNEMPNGGYVKENGITVCTECHIEAETFHSTNGKNWKPGFHPNDLYAIIGSSYEEALEASKAIGGNP